MGDSLAVLPNLSTLQDYAYELRFWFVDHVMSKKGGGCYLSHVSMIRQSRGKGSRVGGTPSLYRDHTGLWESRGLLPDLCDLATFQFASEIASGQAIVDVGQN